MKTYKEKINIYKSEILLKSIFLKDVKSVLSFIEFNLEKYLKIKQISIAFGILTVIAINTYLNSGLIVKLVADLLIMAIFYSTLDAYILEKTRDKKFKLYTNIPYFINLTGLLIESKTFNNFIDVLKEAALNTDKEFREYLNKFLDISDNIPANEVFQKISDNFDDRYIKDLMAILKLNQLYGGDISQKIYSLADNAFLDRELSFKESAISGSGKLLIPLMLFHLPIIIILFIVPILLSFNSVF